MKNINKTLELVASGSPISQALKEVYETRHLFVPFIEEDFDIPVTMAGLSCRAENALMRSKLTTLREAIDYIYRKGWNSIKNIGKTTATEIFEKFLDIAWDNMSSEQRAEFMLRVDEDNKPKGLEEM